MATDDRFVLFGNELDRRKAHRARKWQDMFIQKFGYDPDERYDLTLRDNPYLGDMFGLRDIVRDGGGDPIDPTQGVICATVRMGFGHYRIAMAGMSAARAMGFTPYWLDLLSVPGIAQDPASFTLHAVPSSVRPGETLTAWVDVALSGDWHIYSATTPPGGPYPTEFRVHPGGPFQAVGDVLQPDPIREHDPNFDMQVEYFGQAVRFGVRARVDDAYTQPKTRQVLLIEQPFEIFLGFPADFYHS